MKYIGLLSDTHGHLNPSVLGFLSPCDEIWHAGDIGNAEIIRELARLKPVKAVHGNIDGSDVRYLYPESLVFTIENMKVLMIHIGGYPGRYDAKALRLLKNEKPALFVCGHSHILKIMFDPRLQTMVLNPGAAGQTGFHSLVTALRFRIAGDQLTDMEIFEKKRF